MKKIFIFVALFTCFFLSPITKIHAQTATPTIVPTATTTPTMIPTPTVGINASITPFPTLQPPCLLPNFVNGVCTVIQTGAGDIPTDPTGFIKWLFGFILGLGGTIALLLIIFSGYKMMSSNGDPEKIKGAKETLTSAIVGLVFLIFSMVILQVITGTILGIPFLK